MGIVLFDQRLMKESKHYFIKLLYKIKWIKKGRLNSEKS